MCKYCEKSTYVGDFECVYDEGEFGVWIDKDNMNMGVCYGEEEIEIPIAFCPICGRKIGFLRGGDNMNPNKQDLISKEEVLRIILDKRQEIQDEFDRLSRDNDSFYFENKGLYDAIDETLQELFSEINQDDIE